MFRPGYWERALRAARVTEWPESDCTGVRSQGETPYGTGEGETGLEKKGGR